MKKWTRLSASLGGLLALCVGIHPANAQEGGEARDWVNLLRPPAWLSDFNPIGHQLNTIEEAVPNLHIQGLLWNQTRMPLKGKSDRDSQDLAWGQTGRKRQWDFDSIEFLGELDLRWTPTYNLEFVNIWNQLYDGIYDWDPYWKSHRENHTEHVEHEMKYYRSYKRYLRELYVRWLATPNLTISAGKQQQVWGKIDFQLIDIVNPNDRRMGPHVYRLMDAKRRRIPTWMVDARYMLGEKAYVEAIWNPDFEPEPDLTTGTRVIGWPYDTQHNPAHSFPLAPFIKKLKTDEPSRAFENHEWFLRGGFNWKGFDTMLFYGDHWSDLPVLFFKNFNPTGLPLMTIAPKHTRERSVGLAFDKNINFLGRPMLLIYENKYDLHVYMPEFRSRIPGELPANLARGGDGWKKKNMMTQGFEIDTVWGPRQHYSFIAGAFNVHVFGWNGKVPVPNEGHRNLTVAFYNISIPIWQLEDRLQISHGTNFGLEDGGGQSLVGVTYKFSDFLSADIRWYTQWGNQNDTPYGVFRDRDTMDFRFKYEF